MNSTAWMNADKLKHFIKTYKGITLGWAVNVVYE